MSNGINGTLTYNKTTNTVTITEGTSGAPVTFYDLFLSDRIPELCTSPECVIDWVDSKGTGWSHDSFNTEYDCDGSQGANTALTKSDLCTSGTTYRIEFEIKNFVAGTVWCQCGSVTSTARGADGVFTHYVTSDGTDFKIVGDSNFVGSIDNVYISVHTDETELLAPTSCTTSMSLTRQVHPVDRRALKIDFILDSATVGPGDTLDITGNDWENNAQTESIDVSASGTNVYTSSKKWRSITDIDCTGWADGTLQVHQEIWGVIWNFEAFGQADGFYKIDCNINFGDGSTSTYFKSEDESVYWEEQVSFFVKASATLRLGKEETNVFGGTGYVKGSKWDLGHPGDVTVMEDSGATMLVYDSHIYLRTNDVVSFTAGTLTVAFSTFESVLWTYYSNCYFEFKDDVTLSLYKVNFFNVESLRIGVIPAQFEDVTVRYSLAGLYHVTDDVVIEIKGLLVSDVSFDIFTTASDPKLRPFVMVDPEWTIDNIAIAGTSQANYIAEEYTCNIHVVDKSGNNLQGASVACEDKNGDAAFTTQTTAIDGTITEQQIRYKKWVGPTKTLTTYSPHKFTISKAGYEPLILDNVTINSPINWHLELQNANGAFVNAQWR